LYALVIVEIGLYILFRKAEHLFLSNVNDFGIMFKVDRCHHVLTNPYSCRLYNKDAVIEFLLDKSAEKALGKAASHIKSIKVRCGMSVPQER
jgi:hypothetical protein